MLAEREISQRLLTKYHFAFVVSVLAIAGVVLLIATAPPTVIEGPILSFVPYGQLESKPVLAQPPKGWIRIDAGESFSFYVPPGTTYRPLQGIDSFVGEIVGAHFKMQFDFGRYSADLSDLAKDKGFRSEPVLIDGRQAEITSATDSALEQSLAASYTHVVALYMASATCDRATFAYGLSCEPNRLGIYGAGKTPQDAEIIAEIYKTLRFPG